MILRRGLTRGFEAAIVEGFADHESADADERRRARSSERVGEFFNNIQPISVGA